jgi:hypothetical protein
MVMGEVDGSFEMAVHWVCIAVYSSSWVNSQDEFVGSSPGGWGLKVSGFGLSW